MLEGRKKCGLPFVCGAGVEGLTILNFWGLELLFIFFNM